MSAIDGCLDHHFRWATGFDAADRPAPPRRGLAIVTCMDARLDPAAWFGLEPGDAHVIRNAGGIVTEDVIRSLSISQAMLGTREVLVIQHTDCGMGAATEQAMQEAIETETGVRPHFELGAFDDLEGEVRTSLAVLRETPLLAHRHSIRGFVYDVGTAALREVETVAKHAPE